MENSELQKFQQSDFWTEFKCAHGWTRIFEDKTNILVRTFRAGAMKASFGYVPMAPKINAEPKELESLFEFAQKINKTAKKSLFCVRFDVPIDFATVEERDEFLKNARKIKKIKKSLVDVQPPDTVVLDLEKSEDELLSAMKNKWRYNVRLAEKKGVKVRAVRAGDENFSKDIESFYELYKTTASRDGIGLHPLDYYTDLMKRGAQSQDTDIVLYVASHEDEDLAAIIVLFQKSEAIYLYGCSGNKKRNLMPAYLLQWTAIKDAKAFGSKIYDFYGIPPTNDENHPMHGLYLFKTGFGGREIHRPGSFDVSLSVVYPIYTFAEKCRAWYHKKFLKKIRGR